MKPFAFQEVEESTVKYGFKKCIDAFFIVGLFFIFLLPKAFAVDSTIQVPLGILEGLSNVDSNAPQRYRVFFENALFYGVGENERRLNECGYRLEVVPAYYDNSDPLSIKTMVSMLESKGVWVVIGPMRSTHFIMATEFIGGRIPLVGLMAQARRVLKSKPPIFTMSSGVDVLAKVAYQATEKQKFGKRYASFLDLGCEECRDFLEGFDRYAASSYTKVFTLSYFEDEPDVAPLIKKLRQYPVDFLILPNYSDASGRVMQQVHQQFPKIKFLGADGWGDGAWSLITQYQLPDTLEALSVRAGLSTKELEARYRTYSLRRDWQGTSLAPPYIGYTVIQFLRKLTDDLCIARPKNQQEFLQYLRKQPPKHFLMEVPISVYRLKNSQIEFWYTPEAKK